MLALVVLPLLAAAGSAAMNVYQQSQQAAEEKHKADTARVQAELAKKSAIALRARANQAAADARTYQTPQSAAYAAKAEAEARAAEVSAGMRAPEAPPSEKQPSEKKAQKGFALSQIPTWTFYAAGGVLGFLALALAFRGRRK